MRPAIISCILLSVVATVFYFMFSIIVLQPIGALPKGVTFITRRREGTRFIDSADAMCARETGGVSLLCRMMMLNGLLSDGSVLAKFPYSEKLYLVSTGGATYSHLERSSIEAN